MTDSIPPNTDAAPKENVYDYPRPPRIEACAQHIVVRFNRAVVADTVHSKRVIETTHAPNYYIPISDIDQRYLIQSDRSTFCEWKGDASYFTVKVQDRTAINAAWHYPDPTPDFAKIAGHVAFYVGPMDECSVDDEAARPEEPAYYGGWLTDNIDITKPT